MVSDYREEDLNLFNFDASFPCKSKLLFHIQTFISNTKRCIDTTAKIEALVHFRKHSWEQVTQVRTVKQPSSSIQQSILN